MGDEKIIALNDVNLEIYRKEIICIIGTSGSGKSTLLNMMAGLEKPTKGEIIINNMHLEKMNEKQLTKFRQKKYRFCVPIVQSYPNAYRIGKM
jgi:ABC-type antimicrobial peptide transport system, ATPase component